MADVCHVFKANLAAGQHDSLKTVVAEPWTIPENLLNLDLIENDKVGMPVLQNELMRKN